MLSFGYFSLHKQRKVTRAAEALLLLHAYVVAQGLQAKAKKQRQKLSRFGASHFSLLAQRKVTKRKRALPSAFRAARSRSASMSGIRGRGILPLPRTAHIPVRRPFGVFPRHGRRCGREPGKSTATATASAKQQQQQQQGNGNSHAGQQQELRQQQRQGDSGNQGAATATRHSTEWTWIG
ncbi:hypothetical protein QSH18_07575 [Xanthomonas sp. NCPPB 2654]|uniref:hypothetical protein n=1 Tax=unclassified Xanthomonas TaxID=2643310 RepID=UPI0021DFD03E|nr:MULTISPECIES: hypothetical protein [unclassified Xanthomonas]MDL5365462.1 hypothetical protein [Xanthomonas sp. NCPPB 2654]UYC19194.1 hypothetical protein NUG20_13475 [Xanthomonas sp. CFBP 8443]